MTGAARSWKQWGRWSTIQYLRNRGVNLRLYYLACMLEMRKGFKMAMRIVKTLAKQLEYAEAGKLYRISNNYGYVKVNKEELLLLFNVKLYGKI